MKQGIALLVLVTIILLPVLPASAQVRCVQNLSSFSGRYSSERTAVRAEIDAARAALSAIEGESPSMANLQTDLSRARDDLKTTLNADPRVQADIDSARTVVRDAQTAVNTRSGRLDAARKQIASLEGDIRNRPGPDRWRAEMNVGSAQVGAPDSCTRHIDGEGVPQTGTPIIGSGTTAAQAEVETPAASGERAAVISLGPARIRRGAGFDHETLGLCQQNSPLTVWLPVVGEWLLASCFNTNGYIHHSLVAVSS
ncbi:MAG: hypothetical protein OXB89_10730 [Anaerolineaceae bacterium]|nr:hypothetical protein [Anaerolineaceae bacterium]